MSDRSTLLKACVLAAALFVGTFAVFSRSLTFGFVDYDDPAFVVTNPRVQAGLTADSVAWAFSLDSGYWHPLTWLSLMLDRDLFGDDATGFHAVGVFWHALNGVLVFVLLRRFTGVLWTAALGAAVFAWHPLRVESVTWISERKDVLSGFLFLVTTWAYLGYADRREAGKPRARLWYAGTLVAFACGLLSKSVLVAQPLILLLLDVWPLRRIASAVPVDARMWRGAIVDKLPFLGLAAVTAWLTMLTQAASGAFNLHLSFGERLANAIVSIARYLGKVLWPVDLAVVYPHPERWPWMVVAGAMLVFGAIGVLVWRERRRRPWLMVGWGWFLALLVPVIGLVQVGFQSMADRYSYLPVIGVVIAVTGCVAPFVERRVTRLPFLAAAVLMFGAMLARTWQQQGVWRDSDTLFSHALAVTRDNYVMHSAVGLQRLGQGRMDEAEAQCLRAVELKPDAAITHDALAIVRQHQGRIDEAIEGFQRVLELNPRSPRTETNLAGLLLMKNRPDEAVVRLQSALRMRPDLASAVLGMAHAEIARGNTEVAIGHFRRSLELEPANMETRAVLAGVLARLGRAGDAVEVLEAGVSLAPSDPVVHFSLGQVFEQIGRLDDAVASYERACEFDPQRPDPHRSAGDLLAKQGRFAAAVAHFETLVRIAPDSAVDQVRLGYVYYLLNRREDAIRAWEAALRLDASLPELRERIERARRELAAAAGK